MEATWFMLIQVIFPVFFFLKNNTLALFLIEIILNIL